MILFQVSPLFEETLPDLSTGLGMNGEILSVWDPATSPVSALYSKGWGPDVDGEAILIVTQSLDGIVASDGMIVARADLGGFSGVLPIEVNYVQISPKLDQLPVYDGPSISCQQVGWIFGGMAANVLGMGPGDQWWKVICGEEMPGDSCWISADPAFTWPTTPPS